MKTNHQELGGDVYAFCPKIYDMASSGVTMCGLLAINVCVY